MNINRNNYETYFLLYADNELSDKERNSVEIFVKENADLKQELDWIQLSILQPDAGVFLNKNNLFKTEVIETVPEQTLLLYVDKELNEFETQQVNNLAVNDTSLAAAIELLQQTKLLPDIAIVFPNKNLLYRKETKSIRYIGGLRLAAAAIFIGLIIGASLLYFKTYYKDVKRVAVIKTGINLRVENTSSAAKRLIKTKSSPTILPLPNTKVEGAEQNQTAINDRLKKRIFIKSMHQSHVIPQSNSLASQQSIILKNSRMPQLVIGNANKNKGNQTGFDNLNQPEPATAMVINSTPHNLPDRTVYTASFTDNSNENKEDLFTFSDEDAKKSKITGFLRKAKRILERTAKSKNNGEDLRIANLAFTTK